MNSSNREKAAAAGAEFLEPEVLDKDQVETTEAVDSRPFAENPSCRGVQANDAPAGLTASPEFDLSDFDDDFDDDFEAETPGEYDLDDDEYARALLDIVDFEIEGLEAYRDDE